MQSSLLQQSFDLLLYGMGTVFVFLTLLVLCVDVMSVFINKFLREDEPAIDTKPAPREPAGPANVDPQILTAIQEAIYQHRAKIQP